MINYLAVDTSSRYLTVLAKKGGKCVLRHISECAMQHSVILMEEIEKALAEAELTPAECDFFCAVTGPGSFTGIRIGVSAIKGFALAADKPVKAVTAFGLFAYNVNSAQPFYVVIDAAHSHYYVCGYSGGKITLEPCYLSEEQVKALNAPLYGFENLPFENYIKLNPENCLETAVQTAEISENIHALYVRKSQAEENLIADKRVEI
ncbi:MAG: tRNA (adenosine(37)-N6)-threonylcarbamoyltransferase complex dimerization subunit type 1 TsaB [Clostridia bacterium]|nr:tRNA (adenosine(37)-N6)-threonylcarbamoyltransferase complex dimerization subunit type 1 TsaB [Clostridia bacterium]